MPPSPNHVNLNTRQMSILLGTMCGDGNLRINKLKREKNAKLQLSASPRFRSYLDWKLAELSPLFPNGIRINENRSHKGELHISSPSFVELTTIYNEIYFTGRKILNLDFLNRLDALAISVWYCDDGTVDRNRIDPAPRLLVCSADDQPATVAFWFSFRGYQSTICPRNDGCAELYFPGDSGKRLMDLMKPHIPLCSRYKLGDGLPPIKPIYTDPPRRKI